ncbi:MAG: hypothetical protein L0Y54_20905 [Sporichthyaceae bacterium]|nr:hypothetical protein [Sporichthyaceae bacterium]
MTEPMPGGRRRIDRVLAPGYLDGITALPIEEVRALRSDAEQEETDLSYLRRMLQGRIDVLRAELSNREAGGTDQNVIDQLPDILRDEASARPPLGRHLTLEPTRVGEYRRSIERVIADVDISDVRARTDGELESALAALTDCEATVSRSRKAVQQVADECRKEVARRYRTGEAHVGDLLAEGPLD